MRRTGDTAYPGSAQRLSGAVRTRRALVCAMGIALAAPLTSFSQQQKTWRIGFLAARSRSTALKPDIYYDGFVQELRALGYVEGRNLVIEWRFADGSYERLPALAEELVRLNVDVIVTHGTPGVRAAKKGTTTIPIVMAAVGDAIAAGLVASLGRPGGNVTGMTFFQQELVSKRFELLKELIPRIRQVGYLMNLENPSSIGPTLGAMEAAAKALKVELQQFAVRGVDDFAVAISAMTRQRVEALVVSEESAMLANARLIATLAEKERLCSIGGAEYAPAGGLIGYGLKLTELYRRAAHIVDKVLKGAGPGAIPVERPTVFEVIVNQKTAAAIGVRIPDSILVRADRVIE